MKSLITGMAQRIVEKVEAGYDPQRLGVKILLALLALSMAGTIVCVVLATLRVAVAGVVVAAGVLVVVGLICAVCANGIKYKIEARGYRKELDLQRHGPLDDRE